MKEKSNVRRRKRGIKKSAAAAAAVISFAAALAWTTPVLADFEQKSRGNLTLEGGEINIAAADVDMLQEQINALYEEIPETPNVPAENLNRKNALQSKGNIDYNDGKIVVCADDLVCLANEIDLLENSCKINMMNALNGIGTYFTANGTIVHESDNPGGLEESAVKLPFNRLYEGILNSQSVDHLADRQIYAAVSDNLSNGTAAWVNGKLIIGNGADNNAFYEKGYVDGFQKATDSVDIVYAYHEHSGEQEGEGTGCYTGRHRHTSACPETEVNDGICPGSIVYISPGEFRCTECYYGGQGSGGGSHHRYHTEYLCGGQPYNEWPATCGKTPGVTIESATLIFK
ncbi:MAG: hypothetical protein NC231_07385 [Bacillus sp. (in: Bacteria)]|nr:hypothetical protein [Bacillus sp. (in: firmicutes)]MCM1427410.1 hypothetical protein [Eubacterium sp.]